MTKSLEFYFDFISPYSYLAYKKLKLLDINNNVNIIYKPILLGGLHKLGGITAPAFNERKMKNMKNDCELVAKKNNIQFKWNDKFPINTLYLMRGYLIIEKKFNKNNIIVAYEPIWSIGTGKIPTAGELKKTTIHIKKVLKSIFKKNSPAVLYGGSVDGSNVEMFKEIKEIDGFLIGGASKSSKKFIDIIKNYYR